MPEKGKPSETAGSLIAFLIQIVDDVGHGVVLTGPVEAAHQRLVLIHMFQMWRLQIDQAR